MNNDIKILCGMIHEWLCEYAENDIRNKEATLPRYRDLEKKYGGKIRDLCKKYGGYRKIRYKFKIVYK